jgi:hypothetical protein
MPHALYLSPEFFHFIVATGFEENQSGSGMLYQHCIDDHLDPFMLRLGITGRAHILMSSREQEIGINFKCPKIKQLQSGLRKNPDIPTSWSLQDMI